MKAWLHFKAGAYKLWLRLTMGLSTGWRRLFYFLSSLTFIGFLPDFLLWLVDVSNGALVLIDSSNFVNEHIPESFRRWMEHARLFFLGATVIIPFLVKSYETLMEKVKAYRVKIGLEQPNEPVPEANELP